MKAEAVHDYDLVVIGSGPAGEKGAAQAAYFGKRVAVAERDYYMGGTCAGTTVSSKTLRETAMALSGLRARRLHGVDLSLRRRATVEDFLHHECAVKDTERARVENNMIRHNVDVFKGTASFRDGRTIQVEARGKAPESLTGEVILIATGSSPRHPANYPRDERVYDSDSVLRMKRMPRDMVIVGGGVIGCEYACVFAALGVPVTLIHPRESLLPVLDREVSFALENCMSKLGVDLLMPERLESCTAERRGLTIKLGSGAVKETDAVMVAAGRTGNIEELNLEAAGITACDGGVLAVNDSYQVVHPETREPVPGIYAAGDVIGPPALATTSMEQARFAMIRAFNLPPYKEHVAPILPVGIHTIPECARAGKTGEECNSEKIDHVVGKAAYSDNARGMIVGDHEGFLKLVFEFNGELTHPMRLLGAHIIGETASELIHIGVHALMMGAASDLFINTCFNYPTLGELYKYATYDAMGARAKRLRPK